MPEGTSASIVPKASAATAMLALPTDELNSSA
jgi:hypothetical protein